MEPQDELINDTDTAVIKKFPDRLIAKKNPSQGDLRNLDHRCGCDSGRHLVRAEHPGVPGG